MTESTLRLAGHSGCALRVAQHGDTFVVTKTAKDKAYGARLELQADKQRAFTHKTFRTPHVLSSHYTNDGLYEFSMEYINGFTLAEYLRNVHVADIPALVAQFVQLIPLINTPDLKAPGIHRAKIAQLKSKLPTQGPLADSYALLTRYPWEHSVASYCHGDLTLENIILKDGELYLIDFLDSYYDSWMQDFGKLIFDLETRWSYRTSGVDKNLLTRISIFKDTLVAHILALPQGKRLVTEIYYLALLHAVRIAPYTTDPTTMAYLEAGAAKLHTLIDSL